VLWKETALPCCRVLLLLLLKWVLFTWQLRGPALQDVDWLREGRRLQARDEVCWSPIAALVEHGPREWTMAAGRLSLGRKASCRTESMHTYLSPSFPSLPFLFPSLFPLPPLSYPFPSPFWTHIYGPLLSYVILFITARGIDGSIVFTIVAKFFLS